MDVYDRIDVSRSDQDGFILLINPSKFFEKISQW